MLEEPLFHLEDACRVERVITMLRASNPDRLSPADRAAIACLSPFHFARAFRRTTGIPAGEFAAALLMERAKHLLLTTDLSVTDVCFEIGYSGLGTFVTRFTRLVGVAPGRFRRLPAIDPSVAVDDAADGTATAWERPSIEGRVVTPDSHGGAAFVGLFPSPIIQGHPIAARVLTAPARFRLAAPDGGTFFLLAVAPRIPARGVAFTEPPTVMPSGTQAQFVDQDGSGFVLVGH